MVFSKYLLLFFPISYMIGVSGNVCLRGWWRIKFRIIFLDVWFLLYHKVERYTTLIRCIIRDEIDYFVVYLGCIINFWLIYINYLLWRFWSSSSFIYQEDEALDHQTYVLYAFPLKFKFPVWMDFLFLFWVE